MLYLSPPGGLSFEKVPRTPKESPRGQTYLPIRPAWGTAVTGDGIPSPVGRASHLGDQIHLRFPPGLEAA